MSLFSFILKRFDKKYLFHIKYLNFSNVRTINHLKLKRVTAYIIISTCILVCILITFTIAAQKDSSWQNSWGVYFLFYFLQDILVMPLVFIVIQRILFQVIKIHAIQRNKAFHSFLFTFLNRNLLEVWVYIFY